MATYDPQQTIATWAGITFQGEMDGEHYTAEHLEPRISLHAGSKGFTTFVVNSNETGRFTVMLSQKSPTNALLSAAFAAKVKGQLFIKDLTDTTVVDGAETMIEQHAPIKRGKEIIGVEWKFLVAKLVLVAGGDA